MCACLTSSLALAIVNRKSANRKPIEDDMKVCSYRDCFNPKDAKQYIRINKDEPPSAGRCLPDLHT
jgi:hypothetical protein